MLRIQRKGGETAAAGTYWDASSGERVSLEKAGALPGDASTTYLRFHPAAMLVVGPLMGLLYAIFMPLAAILMVVWVLFDKLISGLFRSLQRVAVFGWRPSEAHLAGRRRHPNKIDDGPKAEEDKPKASQ